jgi:two-component SAPR family response regulator
MGNKKKSLKVLVIGDIIHNLIVADKETLLNCKEIMVKDCVSALGITSRHPSYFDFLFTDIIGEKVNGIDFLEQFTRLSPMTKIIYVIL